MNKIITKPTLVLLAALTASFTAPVSNVEAQSLFELLFNGDSRRARRLRRERQHVQPRVIKKKPRVKTAKNYTYRPAALKKARLTNLVNLSSGSGYYGPQVEDADLNKLEFSHAIQFVNGVDTRARKDTTKALMAHYSENPQFLWVTDLKPNVDAADVLGVLGSAGEYGLQSSDYLVKLPEFWPNEPYEDVLAKLIKFEMMMSFRAVRYALDANGGLVNPNKLSGYHDFPGKKLKAREVMEQLLVARNRPPVTAVSSQDITGSIQTTSVDASNIPTIPSVTDNTAIDGPANYLMSLHPDHPSFAKFVTTLAILRQTVDNAIVVAPETFVRPGKSDDEIPNIVNAIKNRGSEDLLKKFAVELYFYDGSNIYTPDLVTLVKGFQHTTRLC